MAEWSIHESKARSLEESKRLRVETRKVAPRIPPWLDLERLANTVPEPGWDDQANCKGLDLNWFFPERGQNTKPQKAVCAGCSVRYECLAEQLAVAPKGRDFGIFGGTSERERREIRKVLRVRSAA